MRLPTIRGPIEVAIRQEPGHFRMRLRLPANLVAEVHIPADRPEAVMEGGLPACQAPGVSFLRMDGGHAVLEIGGGPYEFEARSV